MIHINQLSKKYKTKHDDILAVDDVSLHIKKGEIFGIIGYSGAGKSTFIRLINRLEEPTNGEVVINDKQITSLSRKQLRSERQKIGMIFQHFNLLWSKTVFENIAFPLEIARVPKKERQQKVFELIDLVGLNGKENAYPSQLSGGQKQRVGIARALANDPDVLLSDEATSALDPETTDDILELLVSIHKKLNLTIIMITHEMHVIQKICHRVAVMDEGKIAEVGDVLDVFVRPKTTTAKRFVQQINTLPFEANIHSIINKKNDSKLLKLHFIGQSTQRSLISEVSRKFNIDLNILQGTLSPIQDGTYGILIVELLASGEVSNEVIDYIKKIGIEVEVLTDVS